MKRNKNKYGHINSITIKCTSINNSKISIEENNIMFKYGFKSLLDLFIPVKTILRLGIIYINHYHYCSELKF